MTDMNPQWIQWSNPTKQYYRKITNLYGGQPGTPEVQWLSDWNTEPSDTYRSADIVKGPIYNKHPKYLWFLDSQNKKLKFSANTPDTLKLNPNQKCGCKTGDCCSESSTEPNCTLTWAYQNKNSADCGGAKGHFTKNKTTCDNWDYMEQDLFYTVPVVDSDNPDQYEKQNFGGTFCNSMATSQKLKMKTWMGCDCRGGKCQNFQKFNCGDQAVYGDEMANVDDPYIAYSPTPTSYRAQWQFIDEENAFNCCSQSPKQIKDFQPLQCKYSFNPVGASKCPELVQNYCKNYWGDKYSEIGNQCQTFLVNSDANVATTQQTIQNYITSRSLNKSSNDESQPQDYISYDLMNKAGDPLSKKYYTEDNTCFASYEANGCSTNPSEYDPITNPCCRDDSRDPFFTQTMPYLCNFQYDPSHTAPQNNMGSVCDLQLQYFCQSFTRDQLAADISLQNICGCNLIVNPNSPPSNPNVLMTEKMKLERCGGTEDGNCQFANPSPYYVNANTTGENCDIICNTALIQSGTLYGKCTQPVCTIDNITINQINSTGGDTTINQNCAGGKCYISNASINEVNSTVGQTYINQNCSTCYITDSNDLLTAQPVDCGTLKPITPTDDSGGSSTKTKSFFSKLFDGNIIILLVFFVIIIVIIGFFIASYYNKKYEYKIETLVPPEGVIFGDDYWGSY
jgi:hypothetical protein